MSNALQTLLQTALLQRPRPWRIVGDGVVEDANGQEVCTVDTQRNLDDDVAAALAQLIAGAPILEAGATLRHCDGRTGAFVSVEDDGRYRVQSLKGTGFWIFHPNDCDRVSAAPAPAAPQASGVGEDFRAQVVKLLDELIVHIVAIGPGKTDVNTPMARRVWREVFADLIIALRAPSREPEDGAVWGAAIEAAAKTVERQIPDAAGGPMSHTNTARVFMFDAVKAIRALATREEAPADHVSDARQMVEATAEAGEPSLVDWFSQFIERHQEGCGSDTDSLIACLDRVRDSYRAQPQASEDAQPVGHFQHSATWNAWEEVSPEYAGSDGVVPLYRHPAPDAQPVHCPRCNRGEVFGLSMDDGSWVEFSSASGGAHPAGMHGWLELAERHPDGRVVLREYVAKDSPIYPAPEALRVAVEALEKAVWSLSSFGQLAQDDEGGNTEGLDDEVVVRMTFPDPEFGGEKTLLGELFIRAFRKARATTDELRQALAALQAEQGAQ